MMMIIIILIVIKLFHIEQMTRQLHSFNTRAGASVALDGNMVALVLTLDSLYRCNQTTKKWRGGQGPHRYHHHSFVRITLSRKGHILFLPHCHGRINC